MMIIFSLAGMFGLLIGGMLLITPDTLYEFNEYINKTCISSQGDFMCRMAIASFSIFVGLSMSYVVHYYSEHNALPPIVNHWLTGFLVHFQSVCQQPLVK